MRYRSAIVRGDRMRPFLGLIGILLAAITSELNDQVTSIALPDILGGLGLSHDPGTWIESLYGTAQLVGLASSPWQIVTFSLRRWGVFVIALCGVSSVLVPFSPNVQVVYAFRVIQGFSGGLIIPLLMVWALRVLPPSIRIYGLAIYALTASFSSGLSPAVAALWVDIVGWRFAFLQVIPLFVLAGTLVFVGQPDDEPRLYRFRELDWRGVLLILIGFSSLGTMLYQGDRLDWFNSNLISVLALIVVIAFPLFVINEWFHPFPLIKFQLIGRRNIAWAFTAFPIFLIVTQASTTVPLQFLAEVQGYRPIQSAPVTLAFGLPQLLLLPAIAFMLDFRQVDPRAVTFVGLTFILVACIGSSNLDITWNRDQFYFWQIFWALGQPMVVVPLLEMSTNSLRSPDEGPFVSALINTPRGFAEILGFWLLQLIARWRGGLHFDRIRDQIGLFRDQMGKGALPTLATPLLANGHARASGGLEALAATVQQQVTILYIADTYVIMACLTVFLLGLVLILPERTLPPRLLLARG